MTTGLPLRVRLVAGFSVATFVVLLAAGAFVYWRVEYALDADLDAELAQAVGTIDPLIGASGAVTNRETAEATGVAWQVVGADGAVLDRGGPAGAEPMVDPGRGTTARTVNVGDLLPAARQPYRVRIVAAGPQGAHLLVGARRDHRDEALRELVLQLVLAGLGTLLVTAFVGDRLARAALRPVERYRQQAAAIAAGATDLRLDVPPGRDDEVTRLGHTFNDMLAALERALDRERQFVNEASHELRTPITLLTGRIQLARRRRRTPEEHEHVLAELEIDLARLARLADQLLALGAAAQAGAASGDLAAVTSRLVDQRRLVEPARAGDLVLEVPATGVPVLLDELDIERLVTNLLANADAHGSPPVEVVVDQPAPGLARITVADTGSGMPADLLGTATKRFARAEEARSRPGAGLGLALVEAVVTRAGGELRLCHDGVHHAHGHPQPVACTHDGRMTATVLLPAQDRTGTSQGHDEGQRPSVPGRTAS